MATSNQNKGGAQGKSRSQDKGSRQSGDSGNEGGGKSRGFASMDPARQREIASEGGKAAHQKGTAHEFTSEEARRAGSMSHGNRQSGGAGSRSATSGGNASSSSRSAGSAGGRGENERDDSGNKS
jgi:hypothetical protein